ncbi:RNase P protein subunit [Tieghemostelium lacteum]|uniref:RNase P protein subunit n=1 Tax=Tieghemostelium lacteum TaxID=361077 RepID=A0A152A7Z9_TIELA|nr:RNase P protein subunit [Tieghemostelium lacteum]|eukprot:KYR02346.1 RNase P protein subunit [Tieghemostelium lacteum]
MYFDLNINVDRHQDAESLKETLMLLMKLGYDSVALTHSVEGKITPKDINKISKVTFDDILPDQQSLGSGWMRMGSSNKSIKQYTRLEVICKTSADLMLINGSNPVVASYDLVSVVCVDQAIFNQACNSTEIDIITLNFMCKYHVKPDKVRQCIQKGIFIELIYASIFEREAERNSFFQLCSALVRSSFGKQIILSSHANSSKNIRSPYDISNIGHLFGMTFDQAKDTVSKNPHSAVLHALTRKTKGVAMVFDTKELQDLELWKLERQQDTTPTGLTQPHPKHKPTDSPKPITTTTTTTTTTPTPSTSKPKPKPKPKDDTSMSIDTDTVNNNNNNNNKGQGKEKRKRP